MCLGGWGRTTKDTYMKQSSRCLLLEFWEDCGINGGVVTVFSAIMILSGGRISAFWLCDIFPAIYLTLFITQLEAMIDS